MKRRQKARGTILIVAIGLIAALAIIGATMISVARVDRLAARNFKQSNEMDLARVSLIEYLQQQTAQSYWAQANMAGVAIVDEPTAADSLIGMVRPNAIGRVTTTTTRSEPGLFRTSTGTAGTWYVLPRLKRLPDPGKTDASSMADSSPSSDSSVLTLPASGGRKMVVAFLMLDLCGRWNLNFHGSHLQGDKAGQSFGDDGYYITDMTPWWEEVTAQGNARRPIHPSDNFVAFVTGSGTTDGTLGRYGASKAPTLGDRSLNYFVPNAAIPYGSDELMELLNLWGTPGMTRLERALPNTLYNDSANMTAPTAVLYRKSMFTTYSAVSGARRRDMQGVPGGPSAEAIGTLCVQADLDRSTPEEIMAAIRSSGATMGPHDVGIMMANLEGFRSPEHKPVALDVKLGAATTTHYGVDAQPFLNEVYVEQTGGSADPTQPKTFKVHIELANPYTFPLQKNNAYTKISIGKGTKMKVVADTSIPMVITGRTPGSWANGTVVTETVVVPAGESVSDYLEPVQLYGRATNGTELVIDRYKSVTTTAGQSMQRKTKQGYDRAGNSTFFFNGWSANETVGPQSCSTGFAANTPGLNIAARPIENRSVKSTAPGPTSPDNLSFRRVGDIGKLLRFGHDAPTVSNGKCAPEKLAEVANDKDAYIDLTDPRYERLVTVLAVNHPYYDGVDNDGDGLKDSADTGKERTDILGPEIYRHGMINIKTAPPEVIRGMIPLQVQRRGKNAWTIAQGIANAAGTMNSPTEILKVTGNDTIFLGDGWDDDGNGAPDDQSERTFLYTYMSNYATLRTDTFAVYGIVQMMSGTRAEGFRRFIAVLDRVPATAYPPMKGAKSVNSDYLPVRVANFMWLD